MFIPSAVAAAKVDPLTVTLNPTVVNGSAPNFPIVTGVCTATPQGGVLPYTYQWTRVSAVVPGSSTQAVSPTSESTAFRANNFTPPTLQEDWRVTVTDAANNKATADVDVRWVQTP